MKRSSRTRWVLKWAGLVVSVLIAVGWAFSLWGALHCIRWDKRSYAFAGSVDYAAPFAAEVGAGCVWVLRLGPWSQGVPEWRISRVLATPRWRPVYESGVRYVIPLWIPFVFVAVPTGYAWWRDRRCIPPGHCRNCGYNLTGNVSGRCPECGTPISSKAAE